jgi:hypothetical protein
MVEIQGRSKWKFTNPEKPLNCKAKAVLEIHFIALVASTSDGSLPDSTSPNGADMTTPSPKYFCDKISLTHMACPRILPRGETSLSPS